jgi:hypothetical protein
MTQLTTNLTVWELIFQSCKPVIVASVFKFLLALQPLLARPASIKWMLLATRNFHSPLANWRAVVSHTDMASSISFWRVLVSVHSPFWQVFEKNGFPHCVCTDWLSQTCGRTEAVANKITRGIIPMNIIYLTITT